MTPSIWMPALCGLLAISATFSPVPSYAIDISRGAFAKWANVQYSTSMERIQQSMQPNGAIYASPSKKDPDYYYFWTRDGGLTMDALVSQLNSSSPVYTDMFERFVKFTSLIQSTRNPSNGVGEPKFNMDGTAYTESWGRPQNDGPAIRAFALTKYLQHVRAKDPNADVNYLYKPDLSPSPIKTDLEYVSHRWQETNFEIWEEVKGNHFYTRLVQYKALKDGAKLAVQMKDQGAADWYAKQASAIEKTFDAFWDSKRNLILTTIGRDGDLAYKTSNVDNQVILASLHAGDESTGLFAPWDDRVLASAKMIIDTFKLIYKINTNNTKMAPAIGRYPEDRYDGIHTTGGNPWMLNTAAHAELLYRVYLQWARTGQVTITSRNVDYLNFVLADSGVGNDVKLTAGQTLRKNDRAYSTLLNSMLVEGDRFLERVRFHTPANYDLTEQWNRDTGKSQGAPELTWSHTAFTTAIRAGQAARAIKV